MNQDVYDLHLKTYEDIVKFGPSVCLTSGFVKFLFASGHMQMMTKKDIQEEQEYQYFLIESRVLFDYLVKYTSERIYLFTNDDNKECYEFIWATTQFGSPFSDIKIKF